jgi:hypothetical protein
MLGLGIAPFRDEEVSGFCTLMLDVGACGVEMGVGGNHVSSANLH